MFIPTALLTFVEPFLTFKEAGRLARTDTAMRPPTRFTLNTPSTPTIEPWRSLWRIVRFPAELPPDAPAIPPKLPPSVWVTGIPPLRRLGLTRLGWVVNVREVSLRGVAWATSGMMNQLLVECPMLETLDLGVCAHLGEHLRYSFLPGLSSPVLDNPNVPEADASCVHVYDADGIDVTPVIDDSEPHVPADGSDAPPVPDIASPPPSHVRQLRWNDRSCARCKYALPEDPPPPPSPSKAARRIFLYRAPAPAPAVAIPPKDPLGPVFRALRAVDLSWCDVTDEDVAAVAIACPSLTSLNLFRCHRVTDVGLMFVARYCRQLRCLDATQCTSVTDLAVVVTPASLSCVYFP